MSLPPDMMMEMSPDDLAAMLEIAGPLYQESRAMETSVVPGQNPVVNSHGEDGSFKIRKALEDAERVVKANRHAQLMQQQMPQQYPQYPQPPQQYPQYMPVQPTQTYVQPQITTPVLPPINDGQMEFSFEKNKQDVTNDLLKEISVKLTKVLQVLEKITKEPTVPFTQKKPEIKNVKS